MVHISLKAEELFHIYGFPITNSLFLSFIVLLIFVSAAFLLRRRMALVPAGVQNMSEFVLEGMLGIMDSVLGNRKKSEQYLPLVGTIFLFILFSNWMGLLPGVGSVGVIKDGEFSPLFRSPASDLNFTLALALIAVTIVNVFGTAALGLRPHFKKYFNFGNPIKFFVGILELISEFAKIISFSFRLFGNVFAGEVLLAITAFLVPYLVPLPFMLLEVFVGFIQAFVFAMLVLVFIALSVSHDHEEAH